MALPVTLRAIGARTGVRRVLLAYAVYCLVEMAMWIGIILYAFAQGGPTLAGIVAVAQLVPSAIVAPLLAGVAERLPRGRALALGYLGVMATCAWTLAALAADAEVWVVTLAATTSVTAIAVARPLHYAVLPQIAQGPDDLVSSISLSSVAEGFALFAGPILAGLGTQAFGTWSVVNACTIAAGLSTALVLGLGLDDRIAERLDPGAILPQVGQGAIAVECRADDDATRTALAAIDDPAAHRAVAAERAFLARLGGGCDLPCGGHATIGPAGISLSVLLASLDGTRVLRADATGTDPVAVGEDAARRLLDDAGGRALLEEIA